MLSSWFNSKANEERNKFIQTFGKEEKSNSPIMLYGKDITYMRIKDIYSIVREHHNALNPDDKSIVKVLTREETDLVQMVKKRQEEKIK